MKPFMDRRFVSPWNHPDVFSVSTGPRLGGFSVQRLLTSYQQNPSENEHDNGKSNRLEDVHVTYVLKNGVFPIVTSVFRAVNYMHHL